MEKGVTSPLSNPFTIVWFWKVPILVPMSHKAGPRRECRGLDLGSKMYSRSAMRIFAMKCSEYRKRYDGAVLGRLSQCRLNMSV